MQTNEINNTIGSVISTLCMWVKMALVLGWPTYACLSLNVMPATYDYLYGSIGCGLLMLQIAWLSFLVWRDME